MSKIFDNIEIEKIEFAGEEPEFIALKESAITLRALFKTEVKGKEVLIHPWLRSKDIVLISASAGKGKTFFSMSLALHVLGVRVFKDVWPCDKKLTVAYLEGEMDISELKMRFNSFTPTEMEDDPLLDRITLLTTHYLEERFPKLGGINFHVEKWRDQITKYLVEEAIEFFVIDNLACLTSGGDENDKEHYDYINKWLIKLKHIGITVIVVHHEGKSGGQRGTSARTDHVNTHISLKSATLGWMFRMRFKKTRGFSGSDLQEVSFKLNQEENGKFAWECSAQKDESSSKTNKIKGLLKSTEKSQKEIAKEIGCAPSLVTSCKMDLEKKGELPDWRK